MPVTKEKNSEQPQPQDFETVDPGSPKVIYREQGKHLRVIVKLPVSVESTEWYKECRGKKQIKLIGDNHQFASVAGGVLIKFASLKCEDTGIYEVAYTHKKMNIPVRCSFGLLVKSTDINWKKVGMGVGIGAAAGAGALLLAAPLAIAGIGFGAGGIVSGSWAAAWMSSAAIANGGAVAAGSAVAVAQSVGAAGLGAAGAAAVGGTGAAAGAGVGGAFSKLVKSDVEKAYEKDDEWMKEKLNIEPEEKADKPEKTEKPEKS